MTMNLDARSWLRAAARMAHGEGATAEQFLEAAKLAFDVTSPTEPCSGCDGSGATCGGHWKCSTCRATGRVRREDE